MLRRSVISCCVGLSLFASALPFPPAVSGAEIEQSSGFRNRSFAITHATIVPKPGVLLKSATLVVRDGFITAMGERLEAPADVDSIDGTGLFLYAGFLDSGSSDLMDSEAKTTTPPGRTHDFARRALASTPEDHRHGLTPEFRAGTSLKLTDEALNGLRQQGFVIAHVLPTGRIASGTGVCIALSGAPMREALLREKTMQSLHLTALGGSTYPNTLMGATAHLRQALLDAQRHALHQKLALAENSALPRPPVDPGWESLQEVREGRTPALFSVTTRDDLLRALAFCQEHQIPQPLLWGNRDLAAALPDLKDARPTLIVTLDFGEEPKITPIPSAEELKADIPEPLAVQEHKRAEWHRRLAAVAEARRKGLRILVSTRGLKNRADTLKALRKLTSDGLPADDLLAALTTDAAATLGIEGRAGTLAVGRPAFLTVMNGPLVHEKSVVRYAIVDGHRFEYHKDVPPVQADENAPKPAAEASITNVAGLWAVDIETADGRTAAQLQLSQEKQKLTGVLTSDRGNGRLLNGTVRLNAVDFTVGIGAGDRTLELKFQGKLENGKLSGELKPAFGAATRWSATRVESKTPAGANPVQLSLEEPSAPAGQPATEPAIAELPGGEAAAATPAVAETPATTPHSAEQPGLPIELPQDRRRRPFETKGSVLIRNATVLTGTGQTLTNTSILVRGGKFAAIGPNLAAEPSIRVIDLGGRYVMPGIIDTHSHIMLTQGINEATQSIVCEVRVKDVVNSDDVSEYRALAGGVTTARLLHGSANVIGGQDAVVKLRYGKTPAEQIVDNAPQGVKFALGENVKFQTNRFPNTRLGVEATLNRAFLEAIDYRRQWQQYDREVARRKKATDAEKKEAEMAPLLPPRRDLRLECLADIVNHQKFIHSHCYRSDEILMLLNVARNLGIRVWSLQHVLEGYKVAPEIVAHGASCSTFADWWAYKVEAFDATPWNAALLHEAGANVVIKSDDWELIRHLNQEASKTIRYGNVPPEQALQSITRNPARELGLDDRIGTIEVGKDADFAVFSGHPFNIFSRCDMTFIDGELYFFREEAPSAMTRDAALASARPAEWAPLPAASRKSLPEIPVAADGRYAIVNATIHPVDAPVIERGTILISEGRIAAIGRDLGAPANVRTIDASGFHVYPGVIDAGTTVGLTEIGRVRETNDFAEAGVIQPDLKAGTAINPDSELIPVARIGGITTILLKPAGGLISGQASLARLSGWTAPEMVMDEAAGLQIQWPGGDDSAKRQQQLTDFLAEARIYDQAIRNSAADARPVTDPRYEAVRPYLHREKPVFIEANSRKEIAEAILFAEREKLNLVLTGATDAWKLAEELKRRDIPVIVGPVMRAPVSEFDPYDAPYANPGRLHAAGVRFCIRSNNASNSRNTPFEAGMAVAFGLPEQAALRSVTLSAAEILGLADRLGSLSAGKLADLQITDGSPLQPTTQIQAVFIHGRPVPMESRQTKFYHRYRQRLHEVQKARPAEPAAATR